MWERAELKKKGLAAFKANYWRCIVAGLLLILFVGGTSVSVARTSRSSVDNDSSVTTTSDNPTVTINGHVVSQAELQSFLNDPEVQAELAELVSEVLGPIIALLVSVLVVAACLRLLIFNSIEIGCRGFFARNTESPASLNELKRGFFPYGRNVCAMLLRDLFLWLWSLLFIVPGVIKRYSYRMVPYILADDPAISPIEAINRSRKMMDGHKWNTFVLDLSFIGWDLLSILTLGLVGVFYADPYQFSTGAELYQVLKDKAD